MTRWLFFFIMLMSCTMLWAQKRQAADTATVPRAEFRGGEEGLERFIYSMITDPHDAYEIGISGKVIIGFLIGPTGEMDSVIVFRKLWPSIDAEVLRAAKFTKGKWKRYGPGRQEILYLMTVYMGFHPHSDGYYFLNNPKPSPQEDKAMDWYERGKLARAAKEWKDVCDKNPNNVFAAYNLGLCLYLGGDKEGACRLWRALLDKDIHIADYCIEVTCGQLRY